MKTLHCAALVALLCGSLGGVSLGQTTTVTVPILYVHHELLVEGYIGNSGPYTFLVDTDTTPSGLDLGVARRLGLHLGSGGTADGVGNGSAAIFPTQIADLRVGTLRAKAVDALAIDLSGLSAKLGRRIDGVLGTSFLDGRVIQINYHCRSIAFLPDAVFAPFTARFHGDDENLTSDVWVGSRRVTATFDTGNAGSILVTGTGIKNLGLSAVAQSGRATTGYGYNGAVSATEAALTGVRIGRLRVPTPSARFMPSLGKRFDVNIGNQILERYLVTFDYRRGLLTLQAPETCKGV